MKPCPTCGCGRVSRVATPAAPQSTHWDGCWRAHHDCAVTQLERLVQTLQEIDRAAREYAPMGVIKALSGAALIHFPVSPDAT